MTTPHDALCQRADIGYLPNVACWCDEIAKVRADERGRVLREARAVVAALVTQSSMSLGHRGSWGDGQRDALAAVDRLIDAAGGA